MLPEGVFSFYSDQGPQGSSGTEAQVQPAAADSMAGPVTSPFSTAEPPGSGASGPSSPEQPSPHDSSSSRAGSRSGNRQELSTAERWPPRLRETAPLVDSQLLLQQLLQQLQQQQQEAQAGAQQAQHSMHESFHKLHLEVRSLKERLSSMQDSMLAMKASQAQLQRG